MVRTVASTFQQEMRAQVEEYKVDLKEWLIEIAARYNFVPTEGADPQAADCVMDSPTSPALGALPPFRPVHPDPVHVVRPDQLHPIQTEPAMSKQPQ